MADFAGTKAKVNARAPFGGHPGYLIFTITLSSTTYVNGNLNLSAIKIPSSISPSMVKYINFSVGGSTAAYMVLFDLAATPTFANLGTLKLFTTTSAEASGSLTLVVRGYALLVNTPDLQ
jgi:hypothetical protein